MKYSYSANIKGVFCLNFLPMTLKRHKCLFFLRHDWFTRGDLGAPIKMMCIQFLLTRVTL